MRVKMSSSLINIGDGKKRKYLHNEEGKEKLKRDLFKRNKIEAFNQAGADIIWGFCSGYESYAEVTDNFNDLIRAVLVMSKIRAF